MTDVPGSAPRSGDVVRPEVRAGLRLALALAGAVLLAVVLGPGALLVHRSWQPLVDLDLRVSRAAERLGDPVVTVAGLLTHLGDPVLLTVATVLGAVLLGRRGRRRSAVLLLVSRTGALVLSQGTKAAVGRARPQFEDPVATAFGSSFPSGHALGAAAFWSAAAVVLLPLAPLAVKRALLVAAVGVPVVVAATRVVLGVHYLSDVTAGLVLGFAWTSLLVAVFALWRYDEGAPGEVLDDGVEQDEEART